MDAWFTESLVGDCFDVCVVHWNLVDPGYGCEYSLCSNFTNSTDLPCWMSISILTVKEVVTLTEEEVTLWEMCLCQDDCTPYNKLYCQGACTFSLFGKICIDGTFCITFVMVIRLYGLWVEKSFKTGQNTVPLAVHFLYFDRSTPLKW